MAADAWSSGSRHLGRDPLNLSNPCPDAPTIHSRPGLLSGSHCLVRNVLFTNMPRLVPFVSSLDESRGDGFSRALQDGLARDLLQARSEYKRLAGPPSLDDACARKVLLSASSPFQESPVTAW